MIERLIRIKLEGTFGLPHELAKKQIDIFKDKNGEYYSKYTRMDENFKKISSKKKLVSSEIRKTIKLLSTIQIPAFPKHQMGCDGGFTEIEITGHKFFVCDEKDTFSTGFCAKNPRGVRVCGVVCSGWLKGGTIRFD